MYIPELLLRRGILGPKQIELLIKVQKYEDINLRSINGLL
jgi:hypothetical protein